MKKIIIKKEILVIFIILGLVGSIMFYPIKMKAGKTCLFHSILGGTAEEFSDETPVEEQNQIILKRYLVPFGFVWWFSIVLLIISYYYLKNSKFKS